MINKYSIQQLKKQPRLGAGPDLSAFVKFFKDLNQLGEGVGLSKLVKINQDLSKTLEEAADTATFFEQRASALNKELGLSSKAAAILVKGLKSTADELNAGVAPAFQISNIEMQKYAISMQKLLPTLNQTNLSNNTFYKGQIQVQNVLRQSIGLSAELTDSYTQYASQNGQNAAQQLKFTKQLALLQQQAKGETIDENTVDQMGFFKQITKDIAEAGSEIQIQYGSRLQGNLELSVMKARKFGFSIKDVAKMGDKLLDIESSIGEELEYQLLSGRRLVNQDGESFTNKMREAVLQGDMNKQAETLNEIIEQEGDHLKNNMFARKQLAKTLGIEEKQLASALQKKMILDKAGKAGIALSLDSTDEAFKTAAAELTKQGEMTAKEFEGFKKQMDTRTTDDILKESLLVQRETLMASLMSEAETGELRKSILETSENYIEKMGVKVEKNTMTAILGATATAGIAKGMARDAVDAYTSAVKGASLTSGSVDGATQESANSAQGSSGGVHLGGSLMEGRSYTVGERGPELFTPSTNGTVTPNANTNSNNAILAKLPEGDAILNELERIRMLISDAMSPTSAINTTKDGIM